MQRVKVVCLNHRSYRKGCQWYLRSSLSTVYKNWTILASVIYWKNLLMIQEFSFTKSKIKVI